MKEFIKLKSLDPLDTHDRLLHFQQQADYISQGCQDCINNRPAEFENHPFYIFAHKRDLGLDERRSLFTQDFNGLFFDSRYVRKYHSIEDVPSTRLLWAPRLTKPRAQENSMLFKAYPPTDTIKVIWMLPARELWDQYTSGKMTENKAICESIHKYRTDKNRLEAPEDDDLPDTVIEAIYMAISRSGRGNG